MRLGRDGASDGVKSVLSGPSWPLAAVMPVTLRSCSVCGKPRPCTALELAALIRIRRPTGYRYSDLQAPGLALGCHPIIDPAENDNESFVGPIPDFFDFIARSHF